MSNTETVFLSAIEPEEPWLTKARLLASGASKDAVEGAALMQGATALKDESEATHASARTKLISETCAQATSSPRPRVSERADRDLCDAPQPQLKALKNGNSRRHAPPAVSAACTEAIPLQDGGAEPAPTQTAASSSSSAGPKRASFSTAPALEHSSGSLASSVSALTTDEITSTSRRADFEFIGRLKQGTSGRVDKVKRKVDGNIFVCKTANLDVFKTEKERQQALAEAKIMGSLNSPYIVQYFDSFLENKSLHIIVQYCERGDLMAHLKKTGVLAEGPIWKIFLRIANALEYLHANQILHRDVKSENVFITGSDDGVRLGDFGLSKILSSSQIGSSTIVGSPTYFSPEQINSEGQYDEKCEVWALGVILYELCSKGHITPYSHAKNLSALMKAIVHEDPPLLPRHITEDVRGLCGMLLNKDPQRRPTVTELLAKKEVIANAKTHEAFLHKVPVTAANRRRSSSRFFDLLERIAPCVCVTLPVPSMTSETKGETATPSFATSAKR